MDGILPLYKPTGMTSADAVYHVRKILKMRKVGHSGTLDPNVDGVLPVALGSGTKAVPQLMDSGKTYTGAITLGFATTTEDLDGEVVTRTPLASAFDQAMIDHAMAQLTGNVIQIPPMFSAVKVNGRRLYDYARNGEHVERPKRQVHITRFARTSAPQFDVQHRTQTFTFEAVVSKGTYIRTLAVDTGRLLGVAAVMSQLTRIKSGGFDLSETVSLERLAAAGPGQLAQMIWPIDHAYADLPMVELSNAQFEDIAHGRFLVLSHDEPRLRLHYQGVLKAIYRRQEQLYRPETMFLSNAGQFD